MHLTSMKGPTLVKWGLLLQILGHVMDENWIAKFHMVQKKILQFSQIRIWGWTAISVNVNSALLKFQFEDEKLWIPLYPLPNLTSHFKTWNAKDSRCQDLGDWVIVIVTGWIRMFTEHEELEVNRVNIWLRMGRITSILHSLTPTSRS